jgi:hypothetical protein
MGLRASVIAHRRTEEERAEAFFFCERRRRRRSPSAMREQLKPSVMLIPELDCGHARV